MNTIVMSYVPNPFKNTLKYGVLLTLQDIKKNRPEVDSNALFRFVMTTPTRETEPESIGKKRLGAVVSLIGNVLYTGYKSGMIENRPKPGREAGLCYANSYLEWKSTGNPPVLVMEMTVVNGKFYSLSPHAINRDKRTGQLYDTDNFVSKGRHNRLGVILRDGEEQKKWLTKFHKDKKSIVIPTMEFGDYSIVAYDDITWCCHYTKEKPGSDEGAEELTSFSEFKSIDLLKLIETKAEEDTCP